MASVAPLSFVVLSVLVRRIVYPRRGREDEGIFPHVGFGSVRQSHVRGAIHGRESRLLRFLRLGFAEGAERGERSKVRDVNLALPGSVASSRDADLPLRRRWDGWSYPRDRWSSLYGRRRRDGRRRPTCHGLRRRRLDPYGPHRACRHGRLKEGGGGRHPFRNEDGGRRNDGRRRPTHLFVCVHILILGVRVRWRRHLVRAREGGLAML